MKTLIRNLGRGASVLTLAALGSGWSTALWAQVSDVAQGAVTAGKTADYFLTQGPLGAIIVAEALVICSLAGVIAYLFKKLDGQSTASVAMVREVTMALQANTAATSAGNVAIAALDRTLQATDDGVEKVSHQAALAAQAAQSRGEEILKGQEVILRRLEDRRA